jgi:hypothetical protein
MGPMGEIGAMRAAPALAAAETGAILLAWSTRAVRMALPFWLILETWLSSGASLPAIAMREAEVKPSRYQSA